MSDPFKDGEGDRPSDLETENQPTGLANAARQSTTGPESFNPQMSGDADRSETTGTTSAPPDNFSEVKVSAKSPLILVETAFLASTSSLIWLINYYFPLGPLLRMFFPVPIALAYLRWGYRAAWMAALVTGLLLSVLMGPTRSILFVIPYALMGVQLGAMWRRGSNWLFSIGIGGIIGTFGFFFRFWLLSILLGEDLWVYTTSQVTELAEWIFVKLGLLAQPSLYVVQAIAFGMVILSNIIYLFVVHLVALVLLDRLGNPIPRPPNWVQVLLDYEE
ncbi:MULTISPECIES: DUF2232 domain-containing protein [Cyanophyceae]|uniref:DUF2232 domain-containing protein n=1 Tax=Cyanophyceae TaxID=3028117 RepID=UPI001F54CE8E|nr:DUF2232 domain-containing protein [Trichocoleus sp. FACHB-69]